LKGFADLYASFNSVPDSLDHEKHATATSENGRIARIILPSQKSEPLILSISSSSTGAEYELWAYQSGGLPMLPDAIAHTETLVNTFNVVSQNRLEDLSLHLPRILVDAHKRCAFCYDGNDLISKSKEQKAQQPLQGLDGLSGDMKEVEQFVATKGRRLIREENNRNKYGENSEDPNNHFEIFPRLTLPRNTMTSRSHDDVPSETPSKPRKEETTRLPVILKNQPLHTRHGLSPFNTPTEKIVVYQIRKL
jgi:hypothetical protein